MGDAVPLGAKWQIFAVISLLELWDECGGGGAFPHYTKGRQAGKYPPFDLFRENVHFVLDLYDPMGMNKKMTEETKEKRLRAEINNGRLAMLGIFSFLCADTIPGSVPALVESPSPILEKSWFLSKDSSPTSKCNVGITNVSCLYFGPDVLLPRPVGLKRAHSFALVLAGAAT